MMAESDSGERKYTFEMTAERARAATEELDAVLWLQNERFYHAIRARMRWRGALRIVALALSVLGLVLAVPGAIFAPNRRVEFVGAALLFVLFFVVFKRIDSLEQAARRGTRKIVASRARRALAPVLKKAPYVIEYALDGDRRLEIRAEAVNVSAEVLLKRVRLAIIAQTVICIFDRPLSQRPLRVLYVPGPAERVLLQEAFIRNGATILDVQEAP